MTQSADFGLDLSCVFDMDPMGATVTGRDLLSQALVRRITTPRGRLLSNPNYGYDVTGEINDDLSTQDVSTVASHMDQEFLKDERVVSSSTTATLTSDGVLTTTTIIQDGAGPFPLVLQISSVSVTVLQTGVPR